jgi:hypothetical protein
VPAETTIALGATDQFTAYSIFSDGSVESATGTTWASQTQSVATINPSTGLATAVGPGTTQITATVNGVTSPAFTLTVAAAGTAVNIAVVSGGGQTAAYGSAFANPLVVLVTDVNNNPVSGATVNFAGSGLSLSSSSAMTGANGQASVTATAAAAGTLSATASTSGVTGTADFVLTSTQVPLTVAATSISVPYGQPIPALTYTVTGFVLSDTAATVLTGAPTESTTATQSSAVGMYPITISQGTLQSNANYTLQFTNGTLTIAPLGTVATPVISPSAGTYTSVQSVTITDSTAGAAIYYTTNGTMPSAGSTQYAGSITVGSTETIEAIAIVNGYTNSAVATAAYTINLPPPSFTIAVNSTAQTVEPGG